MTQQIRKFPQKVATAIAGSVLLLTLAGGVRIQQVNNLMNVAWLVKAPITVPKIAKPTPVTIKAPVTPSPVNPYLADSHGALNHFYRSLDATAKGKGATLILHYGDSPVTADSITADARSILQAKYGDAGHGFLLIAPPWAWYGHRGVDLDGKGWTMGVAAQARAKDGLHGLGGVSFTGSAGAFSNVAVASGQTQVEIQFLRQPGGGTFSVSAGGRLLQQISTDAAEKGAGFASLDLPPDTHELSIKVTDGKVRLFGYSFRRAEVGIVYSSLGLNGGQVQALDRYFDVRHWTEELQHQHPDLLVLNYGTNESVYPQYIETQYPKELREVIGRIKAALPETSILIMSPMDRGVRQPDGEIETPIILPRIVEIQREAAADTGCAFFDTYHAMGGAGTMARWFKAQPRLVSADFMHPLPGGAAKVGALLADALERGFEGRNAAKN